MADPGSIKGEEPKSPLTPDDDGTTNLPILNANGGEQTPTPAYDGLSPSWLAAGENNDVSGSSSSNASAIQKHTDDDGAPAMGVSGKAGNGLGYGTVALDGREGLTTELLTPADVVKAERSDEVNWAIWILAFSAGISGLLFGYDTGYISSVLVTIGNDLDGAPLSTLDKELITSATSLGALIGALFAGYLSDVLGRKAVIAIANVVFVVGAVIQAACHGVAVMIVGRVVVGLGVGLASMIVPLWIGELAPTRLRGRLVTVNVVFITLGQVIAYGLGAAFESLNGGWRFTVGASAVPAFVQLISMIWLPESPRYDIRRGRIDKVTRTFKRIFPHATEEECLLKAEVISANFEADRRADANLSWFTKVRSMLTVGGNRRALFVACGLQALQQLCGFNSLMYFSATIFSSIGFSNPTAVSLIVSVTNFIFTLFALKYIDLVGRRRIMLWTVPGMCIGLVFGAACFHFLTLKTGNQLDPDRYPGFKYSQVWSSLLIVSMIFYVANYAAGVGNVPWQQGELFSMETRGIGTSVATATNWSCNLLIGATYLSLMQAITPAGAFGFYAGLCALGWVACFFGFPDTKRLSLEEVQSIFKDSWGIQAADDLRAEKDRLARGEPLDAGASASQRTSGETEVREVRRTPASTVTGRRGSTAAANTAAATPEQRKSVEADRDETSAATSAVETRSAWAPPLGGVVKMSGSSAAVPSNIPASAMSRSTSPHARRGSAQTNHSRASSAASGRSVFVPRVSMEEGKTSPLAKMGIKGDGLMLFITCFASLGVFLFGYDQGVMSGIITGPYFKSYFNQPTSYELGTMVAILEVGAFITSLACGRLADIFGRKAVIFWGAIVFAIGGLIQTFTTGFPSMVVGRIVSGFGVGTLSMIVPTYQSEISPAENRGKLACIEFTGNIVGYASSVWVDYFCSFIPSHLSWRIPLSLQCVIGIILAFGSLLLPESPRWLLDRDQDEDGMRVLADLHGGGDPHDPRARLEYREIKENVFLIRTQGDRGYLSMWRRYKYRVLIAMSSQAFAQLNGINVISYYAPLVFESAGWVGRDAILMTGINGIIYVLATVPTWYLVDMWGRRLILLSGAVVMFIALSLCGWFLYLDERYTPQAVVGCVIVFNAAFGYSWGPIPWLYPPEIMPLAFRAKGASLSTATNWLFNWIVGEATPILQDIITWRLYPMHAFFCACSFVLVYFCYPETMGCPLEEMDALFGDEPGPVPQYDEEEEEEGIPSEPPSPTRPIRRSISSHPRFMSEEERAARAAAARVAAEERARQGTLMGVLRGALGRVLGSNAQAPDRRLYETLRRDEH